MSISYWLDETRSEKPKEFDAVIVGGGITGLSLAWWLTHEDPSLRVAILEKKQLGAGASGRNAGFVTCGSVEHFNRMIEKHGLEEATSIWKFAQENLRLLREHIIGGHEEKLQFEKNGAYSLAAQKNEFEELQEVAKIMESLEIPTEVYGESEVYQRIGAKGFVGGIKYLDDASIHPIELLKLIKEKTQVEFFDFTEVSEIEATSSGDRLLRTDRGNFIAPMALLTLNGYSAQIHPWFKDKIYATRGQCLMFEPVERFMEGPCYANFYLDYFRQIPSGELLIGGFRQLEKDSEVGYSDHTTETIQNSLDQFVRTHLPQYQEKKVTHRWGGVMGFSADGQPMVGSLPGDSQVFFAGGYTAHGIGLAFHTAKSLVDLIYGREVPSWLSARRF